MNTFSLRDEAAAELSNILQYWMDHTVDKLRGGFVGRIDHDDVVHSDAEKGVVLNARILWSFSAAYNLRTNPRYAAIAKRAFDYIREYFVDREFGGVYWALDATGLPSNTRKQIYAQAFVIYACSEYYLVSEDEAARQLATDIYHHVQRYSYDPLHGGYLEAFTREWDFIDDARLSDKDENEVKTMNTHLHVLEAYSSLFKIWPDNDLEKYIRQLLQNFSDHIIDKQTGHLDLFFTADWTARKSVISFGHDIEASWLLQEAAGTIGDEALVEEFKEFGLTLIDAAVRGLDEDGGLWYEFIAAEHKMVREKHWWPQAEALVAFVNAWEITNEATYYQRATESWDFIRKYIIDKRSGEWVWGVDDRYNLLPGEDKVGFWKCPYHNSRACIELVRRLDRKVPD